MQRMAKGYENIIKERGIKTLSDKKKKNSNETTK